MGEVLRGDPDWGVTAAGFAPVFCFARFGHGLGFHWFRLSAHLYAIFGHGAGGATRFISGSTPDINARLFALEVSQRNARSSRFSEGFRMGV